MSLSLVQKGRLGETAVILELQKRGYDVVNLNDGLSNFKNADLFCSSPSSGKHTLIQVKTGFTNNILTGLVSTNKGEIVGLEEKITCPWVFVYVKPDFSFQFYVLTRDEVIDLIKISNDWYTKCRVTELKGNVHVGIDVKWLEGQDEKSSKVHPDGFTNPLSSKCHNEWVKLRI